MKVLEALDLLNQLSGDTEVTLIFGKANITTNPSGPAFGGFPYPYPNTQPSWPSINGPIYCKTKAH